MTIRKTSCSYGILRALLNAALFAAATIIALVLLVEWAAGCGEPLYHGDGTFVTGACIVVPHEPVTGRWRD